MFGNIYFEIFIRIFRKEIFTIPIIKNFLLQDINIGKCLIHDGLAKFETENSV